ncbi:hypothetical protein NDU88_002104 [Pleurodeles waltl]|uniref:Shisa N-terminal domain-containing protein n=1 Tax=Pleurodeles waltl TaxID=8319 RepID=A0AAV7T196_PLEWA|nr:hypothetical protein NDU88_002104 [Pleurodeles waltl]
MSAECTSYTNAEKVLVSAFSCPRVPADSEVGAVYCCGFRDNKYCCDDPNSYFPYDHNYMWWLRRIERARKAPGGCEAYQLANIPTSIFHHMVSRVD